MPVRLVGLTASGAIVELTTSEMMHLTGSSFDPSQSNWRSATGKDLDVANRLAMLHGMDNYRSALVNQVNDLQKKINEVNDLMAKAGPLMTAIVKREMPPESSLIPVHEVIGPRGRRLLRENKPKDAKSWPVVRVLAYCRAIDTGLVPIKHSTYHGWAYVGNRWYAPDTPAAKGWHEAKAKEKAQQADKKAGVDNLPLEFGGQARQ